MVPLFTNKYKEKVNYNIMKFLKAHWKELLIVVLCILFFAKCSSSGNYERKYKKQVAYTEYAIDSMKTMYSNSARHIDSLNRVIELSKLEIKSLSGQLEIYKMQNDKLNEANKSLANKKVIVNIEKDEKQLSNETE